MVSLDTMSKLTSVGLGGVLVVRQSYVHMEVEKGFLEVRIFLFKVALRLTRFMFNREFFEKAELELETFGNRRSVQCTARLYVCASCFGTTVTLYLDHASVVIFGRTGHFVSHFV